MFIVIIYCVMCRRPADSQKRDALALEAPLADLSPALAHMDFDDFVAESDVPILVDFYAPWCGPCQLMSKVVKVSTTIPAFPKALTVSLSHKHAWQYLSIWQPHVTWIRDSLYPGPAEQYGRGSPVYRSANLVITILALIFWCLADALGTTSLWSGFK